ncbi:hypothetical protein KKB40_01860 [Patescibacteria group bacterium]|nr:hypothetical protein [Patescibacteria group bacterium]
MIEISEADEKGEGKCMVGEREVPCPDEGQQVGNENQTISWDKHILTEGLMKDTRNDFLFYSVLLGVMAVVLGLLILKVKIFGKTLVEYIKPIWPYILVSILTVFSQYLIGIPYSEKCPYFLNITQGLWVSMVALSVIRLSKEEKINFGNLIILGVIYSIVIHGLKISIRYLFYEKTIYYLVDRFVYGSFLVMVTVFIIGSVFMFLRKKGVRY